MSINIPKIPRRLSLPRTLPTDLPSALAYIKTLSETVQSQNDLLSSFLSGAQGADALTTRPATGIPGRTFWDTTACHFYVDTPQGWVQII